MKSVSVAGAQARLPELIRVVESGIEIRVTEKRRGVAKIVPLKNLGVDWAETWEKLDDVFNGKIPCGKSGSRIVIEGRR